MSRNVVEVLWFLYCIINLLINLKTQSLYIWFIVGFLPYMLFRSYFPFLPSLWSQKWDFCLQIWQKLSWWKLTQVLIYLVFLNACTFGSFCFFRPSQKTFLKVCFNRFSHLCLEKSFEVSNLTYCQKWMSHFSLVWTLKSTCVLKKEIFSLG